jgi:hypothetical protein
MKIARLRIQIAVVLLLLVDYAGWTSSVALARDNLFCGLAAVLAVVGAFGIWKEKTWSRPFVYSVGLIFLLQGLGHGLELARAGALYFISAAFIEATAPVALRACLVAFCCYVVSTQARRLNRSS